jgi:hypothetical protein
VGSEKLVNTKLPLVRLAKSIIVLDVVYSWASKEISIVHF